MSDKYAAAGVDYDVLDSGKRAAVAAALQTSEYAGSRGVVSFDESRGESAFVYQVGDRYFAQVLECLGTKSTIARVLHDEAGLNRFDAIGYDTVAAIVNDVCCVGALPLVVNAYFATGSPQWYAAQGRFAALVAGWQRGCQDAGAVWGGGESPGLSGIVVDTEIDLAGSATAAVPAGMEPILGHQLQAGDAIVAIASNGIHANGISLARQLATQLPQGYHTKLSSGRSFGEAILDPSTMYVAIVEKLLAQQVSVHYISHITGHGLRKIMRADKQLSYRIADLGSCPEVLTFVTDTLGMTAEESYGTLNMGFGFAVYCPASAAADVVSCAEQAGHHAWVAGTVTDGPREVVLEPLGVTFADDSLSLR